MHQFRKILLIPLKVLASLILLAMLAVVITGISPVYDFIKPAPFSGPDIFNPYHRLDTAIGWKRANFHTHTKVEGLFNECEEWPSEVYEHYKRFGYDIVTFSNHNRLTEHPIDSTLQVNVYEHGYNLFKYHKLVFGSERVNRFDHLIPLFPFQKQFQLAMLGRESDLIQMNHPLRTEGTSREQMQKLCGYDIMELDSGRSTENEYWDWALSAGHYSFGLANDDLHHPERTHCIAVRCNFLNTETAVYSDILEVLDSGCYYSMRIPDYGKGDMAVKIERNGNIPYIRNIGLEDSTVFISVSSIADSITVTGQDHRRLMTCRNTADARYTFSPEDAYARFTVYFPDGEVIYSNPFARYDSSAEESPLSREIPPVNIPLTILFNLMLAASGIFIVILLIKLIRR